MFPNMFLNANFKTFSKNTANAKLTSEYYFIHPRIDSPSSNSIMTIMQRKLKGNSNISNSMGSSSTLNGQKIQEDLEKTIREKMEEAKGREVVRDKTDGGGMIDGAADRLPMTEVLQVTVGTKITKVLYHCAQEI